MNQGDKVSILKKGSKYLTVYTNEIRFLDILLFTSPVPLSKYLKQWSVEEEKAIFPYDLFSNVEDLVAQIEFPSHLQFYNQLTDSHANYDTYVKLKSLYNYHINLPNDHPEKWNNFGNFLDYYNKLGY